MLPENQIVQGDSVQILKAFPSKSVNLVVTDPPYLVNYRDRSGRTITNDSRNAGVLAAFSDAYRVLKPDSFCVSFYGWNRVDEFFKAWRQAGFRPVGHIVWQKDYSSSAGFLQYQHEQAYLLVKGNPDRPAKPIADVRPWEYSGNRTHPTEKAVSILTPLIESSRAHDGGRRASDVSSLELSWRRSFSKPGEIVYGLNPTVGGISMK